MGAGATTKRRRTGTDSSLNSATPSRQKTGTGRGRGRPPNAPRDGRERPPPLAECFKRRCGEVLDRLSKKDHYNIFLEPVNTNDVQGYLDVIKHPMDFTTMRTKLADHVYKSLGEFRKDLDLIWSNCLLFNGKEPTNVFSKKAIELRRLTEKLIVTTRQHLEKDKETLQKWKEKHRKRRETMAANAANATVTLHGAPLPVPSSSMANRDHRSSAVADSRDPMLSTDFTPEDHNGRTPEQNALAESLRLQYAGTTGLFKKSMLSAPLPQYTKPDGSIVQIPLIRYNPEDDHWTVRDEPFDSYRHGSAPELYCDALPESRESNPCSPETNSTSIFVKHYAQSLYNFVKDDGPIAIGIVTELLSPELALKAQHDELSKQGLTAKEIAKRIKEAKHKKRSNVPLYRPKRKWGADAIIELADDIEKMSKRKASLLPHLSRSINELDGIKGLAKFLDKDLVKEVDEVPVDVVDFAMPHGVSLSTISEIHRLASAQALQLPASEVRCVESLRKAAQDYLSRIGPEAASQMTGASLLSPAQLHEAQLRHHMIKRHRRHEAEKQGAAFAEYYDRVGGVHASDPSMIAQQATAIASHRSRAVGHRTALAQAAAAGMRNTPDVNTHVGNSSPPQLRQANAIPAVSTQHRLPAAQTQAKVNALPPGDKDAYCKNCGTRDTLGWRAGAVGPDGVERLCIPCGQYWEKARQHRPQELWGQSSQRKQATRGSPPNGRTPVRPAAFQTRSSTPSGSPTGVGKRPIQKRTPQSSSRRSPSSSGSHGRTPRTRLPGGVILEQSAHLPQAVQPLQSLPSSIHTTNGNAIPGHGSLAVQNFAGRDGSQTGGSVITQSNLQALQRGVQHSTPTTFTGGNNLNGSSGVTIQPTGAHAMNPALFARQQAAAIATQQQLRNLPSTVSAGFIPAQKPNFAQNNLSGHVTPSQALVTNAMNAPFVQPPVLSKDGGMLLAANGLTSQEITAQAHLNNLQPRSITTNPQKMNANMQFSQSRRDSAVPLQNPAIPTGVAASVGVSPYVIPQSNVAGNSVGGVGDARVPFSNGGPVNNAQNSEQMMESLLFGDGGISASPPGPPEFDF